MITLIHNTTLIHWYINTQCTVNLLFVSYNTDQQTICLTEKQNTSLSGSCS